MYYMYMREKTQKNELLGVDGIINVVLETLGLNLSSAQWRRGKSAWRQKVRRTLKEHNQPVRLTHAGAQWFAQVPGLDTYFAHQILKGPEREDFLARRARLHEEHEGLRHNLESEHPNYLKWIDDAETERLRAIGLEHDGITDERMNAMMLQALFLHVFKGFDLEQFRTDYALAHAIGMEMADSESRFPYAEFGVSDYELAQAEKQAELTNKITTVIRNGDMSAYLPKDRF